MHAHTHVFLQNKCSQYKELHDSGVAEWAVSFLT